MADFISFLQSMGGKLIPLGRTIITIIIFLFVFNVILNAIKKALLKKAKTKHLKSNIKIFTRISKYAAFLAIAIFGIFSYAGAWTGLGLSVGLFSAALGWALQKPITGIAGWIMVIIKRPFEIGDRIIIGKVKGDVVDITLTHIYIGEIGGLVGGEEISGRVVMVPNSKLFEQDIINYTLQDDTILNQVTPIITFESNIDKAIKITEEITKKYTKQAGIKDIPYTRISINPNGMEIRARFYSPAKEIQKYTSLVAREIHKRFMKEKDIRLSYPHNEVIINK